MIHLELYGIEGELIFEHSYGDESYGFVVKLDNRYNVYEIPLYGGEPQQEGSFKSKEDAIKLASNFT